MPEASTKNRRTAARRRLSAVEIVGPVGLGGLGLLHAAWALGWRWPGGSDEAWAERLGGTTEMPTDAETWMMALVLIGGSGVVAASSSDTLRPPLVRRLVRFAAWGGSAALIGRALYFLPQDLAGDPGIFDKLDLTVYAPLSATLGICIATSLRRSTRRAVTKGD
ncbi:DUF3995 domain-containing protein [Nocardioides panzhihuensis]|uniref:DUF3995 domain-containing protein n=1 Tax=Nocardioides panzhihuensis TaxID=860243 RepID=A0A7Z0IUS8_9ACTN|nr:DUF3995 domain-containing protein [Nocardioides panzhihuensis]NYI80257.1 hypothetical protein [Nocardioides panzhihuensis]